MPDYEEIRRYAEMAMAPLAVDGYFLVTYGEAHDTYVLGCFDDHDAALEAAEHFHDDRVEQVAVLKVKAGEPPLFEIAYQAQAMKHAWMRRN